MRRTLGEALNFATARCSFFVLENFPILFMMRVRTRRRLMGGLSSAAVPDRAANTQGLPTLARRPLLGTDPIPRGASTPSSIGSEAGIVNVRSYVRTVDGKPVTVSAHTRGDPPGGQKDAGMSTAEGSEAARSIEIAYRRSAACEAQFARDQRICNGLPSPVARRSCWASAMDRYVQCGRGAYIPPLVIGR
jgi:hypothetical protein